MSVRGRLDTDNGAPLLRAKQLAREIHRPVYVKGGEVLLSKPRGNGLTVWPTGAVSMGFANTQQTAREVERRHSPVA